MTIEITLLISVLSVVFAIFTGVANMKRNKAADDRKEATEMTTVIVKLENISKDTSEIKNELRSVKAEVQGLRERVTVAEQLYKAMHERMDGYEKQLKQLLQNK